MFLGHFGVAFAAKRVEPRVSLGSYGFAAQFLDELWPILVLAGVEHVRPAPGLMPASQLDFVSYPISHSLLMAAVWGVLIGALYFAIRRYRRGAIVLGLTVVSHWALDLPMHRADLPLWPGSSIVVGLGAWRSIPLTLLLDGGTFLVGLILYLRASRARRYSMSPTRNVPPSRSKVSGIERHAPSPTTMLDPGHSGRSARCMGRSSAQWLTTVRPSTIAPRR